MSWNVRLCHLSQVEIIRTAILLALENVIMLHFCFSIMKTVMMMMCKNVYIPDHHDDADDDVPLSRLI